MKQSKFFSLAVFKRRDVRGWAIVGVVLALLVGLSLIGSSRTPVPYDPDSVKPDGTKAFVMLMERTGTTVARDSYPHGKVAILLQDNLTQKETDAVDDWVSNGGTLINADTYSSLQRSVVSNKTLRVPSRLTPDCQANFLNGVSHISPDRKQNEQFFQPNDQASVNCFSSENKAYYLQAGVIGKGRIIDLGGADIFTNDRLGKDDNSVLLTNLIKPDADASLTLLETRDTSPNSAPAAGSGLGHLINRRVKDGFWLLVTSSFVFILYRARRLGAPIDEEPLVRIPSSQLVLATGGLLELANQPAAAAQMIRNDFKTNLSNRFGFRPDLEVPAIADLVAARTGIDRQRLFDALREDAVHTQENLVAYAQHVEMLHQEVKRVR